MIATPVEQYVSSRHREPRQSFGRQTLFATLWVILVAGAAGLTAAPRTLPAVLNVQVGAPAPQDVLAPISVSFESAVLTQQARERAAAAVPDVYDPPNSRIARQQVLLMRDVIGQIDDLRRDTRLSLSAKQSQLTALPDVPLTDATASLILRFSQDAWLTTQQEALTALERVMQSQVRADQLETVRRSAPALLGVDLTEEQVTAVTALINPLIIPNSLYDDVATNAARQVARDNVGPVVRQIIRGQSVLTRGIVVGEADLEALRALGLSEAEGDQRQLWVTGAAALLAGALLAAYCWRFRPEVSRSLRMSAAFTILALLYLAVAVLAFREPMPMPLLLPTAALAIIFTALTGPQFTILAVVLLSGLVGLMAESQPELAAYNIAMGVIAAIVLQRADRLNLFFWAGLGAALAGVGVLVVSTLRAGTPIEPVDIALRISMATVNGGASTAIALLILFAIGGLLGFTTTLQLVELSRPDHPLLRYILRNAPGTYQHSLQVANLAEQAAELIGINPLLMRVAALYHDSGKALNPQYFIENQLEGHNIHSELDPVASAERIIRHVEDGLMLANRHRLPPRIRDFIAEHHGTLSTRYQYARAVAAAGGDESQVDERLFTYPGPAPRSRETAVLMLADSCEAKTRADRPSSDEHITRIVTGMIEDRVQRGQLENTGLTLQDLAIIRRSFITTLRGLYHTRIQYPDVPTQTPQATGDSTAGASPQLTESTTPTRHAEPNTPPSQPSGPDPIQHRSVA
ncbi:MAG TPA: HDIG domain-containing protein [Anaerolineales bacterium]|nr:HDIG domain-containing protein [Anaerolineales bacterium]